MKIEKEPKIDVKIAWRAKENLADDFKMLINYRVMLSDREMQSIK